MDNGFVEVTEPTDFNMDDYLGLCCDAAAVIVFHSRPTRTREEIQE
jgi:hypothetical protein